MGWMLLRAVIYRLETRRWGQTPIPNSVRPASPAVLFPSSSEGSLFKAVKKRGGGNQSFYQPTAAAEV